VVSIFCKQQQSKTYMKAAIKFVNTVKLIQQSIHCIHSTELMANGKYICI